MTHNTYPGGKSGPGVYQQIINQLPPHRVYIEPFLGGGAILRHKKPAACSIAIDADQTVIDNWNTPIPATTIICDNAISWLENHIDLLSPDTLIYCDPPYLMTTRSKQTPIYNVEMTTRQHIELLEILDNLTCMIAISGYWSNLYGQRLCYWRCISYNARTRGGRTATEYLWMNYDEPIRLHDYKYLGDNYRERERIKRKVQRWTNKLKHMDPLERYAILAAIETVFPDTTITNNEPEAPPHIPLPDRSTTITIDELRSTPQTAIRDLHK